jgi:hypothetical protein
MSDDKGHLLAFRSKTSEDDSALFVNVMTKYALPCNSSCFVAFGFVSLVFWLTGLSDFLQETPFKEFKWPPYVNVHQQVVREMLGQNSEVLYHNDWGDYVRLIEPTCKKNRLGRKRALLIAVKTSPERLANRDAIRNTWGSTKQHNGFRIATVFVMGRMSQQSTDLYGDILGAEQRQYGDLLVGDFIDSYRNNTLKFIHSIGLARNYCGNAQGVSYVLLVDDDYMVSMGNLIAEIEKHPPNERLYMGWRIDTSPFRLIFAKHRVSLETYPYDLYPPYVTAGAVLLTSQTVKEFYLAIQHSQVYLMDDIYAGIISYLLGIPVQHNDNFRFWKGSIDKELYGKVIAVHGFSSQDLLREYKNFI